MSEWDRIARLGALYGAHGRVGIGDDAAVLDGDPRPLVLSCDASVEGVHFERRFASWEVLARRAAIAALSDLCAMGAEPRGMLSSLVLPAELGEDAFDAIARGVQAAASECGAPVVGGNLSRGPAVILDTTVFGALCGPPLTRSGAQEGDGVFVQGFPGAAALGLHALLQERDDSQLGPFVHAWRHPKADFSAARRIGTHASAGIDISDGLLSDLGHLCSASGVGARLEWESIPKMDDFDRAAARVGKSVEDLVLGGGEDYVLLFTSAGDADGTRIGEVEAERGLRLLRDGSTRVVSARGHDHFG